MMLILGMFAVFALGLCVTEYRAVRDNMNAVWNGLGCCRSVLRGSALNPMQNRPLIPWYVSCWPRRQRTFGYVVLKGTGIFTSLWTMYLWLGLLAAAILGLLIAGTFCYDYADYAWELAFINLSYLLGGWAWVVIVPWALMRESAVFGVLISACGGFVAAASVSFVLLIVTRSGVRLWYGAPRRYVSLKQVLDLNWGDCHEWARSLPFSFVSPFTVSLTWITAALTIVVICSLRQPVFPTSFIVPFGAMLGAALIWGKWNETRVFLPAMVPVIAVGIGLNA